MENDDIEKLIQDSMLKLPEVIRKSITESGWEKTIRTIVKKYNLKIDQGSNIETETFLIMLGVETQEQYLKNLTTEAKLTPEIAAQIAQEVNEQIFSLIREKIIEKTENGESQEEKVLEIENTEKKDEPARADILKEIEDKDETAGHSTYASSALIIEPNSPLPSTQVNTAEQNQEIISKNSIAQKLQTPSVSAPKTVTVDPYREMPL
jgi:ribosomal protein L31E